METLPITYRDYTIKRGEHTKFEFVHNEYDGPGDNRLGACDTLEDCMTEIDEQLDGKNSGIYEYNDSLFKAVAQLTKPVEEEK